MKIVYSMETIEYTFALQASPIYSKYYITDVVSLNRKFKFATEVFIKKNI